MSKPQTVHTMQSLLKRTEEVGNCKEWQGYISNQTPKVCHEGKMHSVRRVMLKLLNKKIPAKSFVSSSCCNQKCVNPDHIVIRNLVQHAGVMAGLVQHQNPARLVKLTQKAQVRRKLTDEQIEQIRMTDESCAKLARDFNVNRSLVSRIRRGEAHRVTQAINNPFWQLYG